MDIDRVVCAADGRGYLCTRNWIVLVLCVILIEAEVWVLLGLISVIT